jgi:hypothetical protein
VHVEGDAIPPSGDKEQHCPTSRGGAEASLHMVAAKWEKQPLPQGMFPVLPRMRLRKQSYDSSRHDHHQTGDFSQCAC